MCIDTVSLPKVSQYGDTYIDYIVASLVYTVYRTAGMICKAQAIKFPIYVAVL